MGRPSFKPSQEMREHVAAWVKGKVSLEEMARRLQIAPKTLRKHFADELGVPSAETVNTQRTSYLPRIALDLLRKAIDEAGEPAPASQHIPPKTRTISLNLWRSYCNAGTVSKSDEPDAKRKAFVRSCETLQQRGIIGIWSDHVWLK